MPDLQDLDRAWAVLDARADNHPLADLSSLTAAPRPSRRGRIGLAAAAVLTIAAVAIVAALWRGTGSGADVQPRSHEAVGSPRHASPTASASAEPAAWTTLPTGHYLVVVDAISEAYIRSVIGVGNDATLVQPGDQYQEVQVVGPPDGVVIKVNAPGWWTPSGGRRVSFDGTDAFYGTFLRHPELPGHPVPPRVSLAWQYQPGAWATIGSMTETPISLEDAEHYASLVKIQVGDPLPDPLPQDK